LLIFPQPSCLRFDNSEVAADAFGQYNLTTGIINEGVKAVYDTIGRIKGTRLYPFIFFAGLFFVQ
jgi:hypothetical protein